MKDRKMIQLAAKAARIRGAWGTEGFIERHEGFIPEGWIGRWNPLDNTRHTFELMTKLRLLVQVGKHSVVVCDVDGNHLASSNYKRGLNEAVCYAITRAAATIGEK